MKILVDADACPVKSLIVKVAREHEIQVLMFMDTSHMLEDGYSEVITVGRGRDAVDMALINQTNQGDIVVTQDYGVATMALSRRAYAISQNGLVYTQENMDRLLFERFLSQKVRRAGGRTANPRKRKKENNETFEAVFRSLCIKALKNRPQVTDIQE